MEQPAKTDQRVPGGSYPGNCHQHHDGLARYGNIEMSWEDRDAVALQVKLQDRDAAEEIGPSSSRAGRQVANTTRNEGDPAAAAGHVPRPHRRIGEAREGIGAGDAASRRRRRPRGRKRMARTG